MQALQNVLLSFSFCLIQMCTSASKRCPSTSVMPWRLRMEAGLLGHNNLFSTRCLGNGKGWLEPMYFPRLLQKRSLNATVDLPFDDCYTYFCTYAFESFPNAYWGENISFPSKSRYPWSKSLPGPTISLIRHRTSSEVDPSDSPVRGVQKRVPYW